jgi:tetratricopeptide (TPR) repeat protein
VAARTSHFEVYSQAGPEAAARALAWLEQLREFFANNELLTAAPPVRVIGFRSARDYDAVRHRPSADAYFLGTGEQNYIVMPLLEAQAFATAAHEYTHAVLHAIGLHLPKWLGEGLAGYFATIRFNAKGYELGGHVPDLHRGSLPLPELFEFHPDAAPRHTREQISAFYSESWALADLLLNAPDYAPRFRFFISALNAGHDSAAAFSSAYGRTLEQVRADLAAWVHKPHVAKAVLAAAPAREAPVTASLGDIEIDALLGDLLLALDDPDGAQTRFLRVAQARPSDPDSAIALGKIALLRKHPQDALHYWRQAFDNGVNDPEFYYRYALLAEDLGRTTEMRTALERALAQRPGFDDARFHLALELKREGEYRAAVHHFRAMQPPNKGRAYAYWISLASALIDLDERAEAKQAAEAAMEAAQNDRDRSTAQVLRVVALTDPAVQFATGEDGRARIVSTRTKHGSQTWNPFIEPADRIERAPAQLIEVLCAAPGLTGFVVQTEAGKLTLQVPDPGHVLMRNTPGEFTCGRQTPRSVQVEYALSESGGEKTLLLRGMTF